MKKQLFVTLMAAGLALSLAACGASGTRTTEKAADSSQGSRAESGTAAAENGERVYKVGILKFMDHPSLNQIEASVKEGLETLSGDGVSYEIEDLNGQGDASVLNQMTAQLLSDQVDVIVPIATPAAQIVQAATEDQEIPVIFSAVSDPITAKLVTSMEKPGKNISGTSDALNTNAIMDLMLAQKPDTGYVGLLYSKSEDSSKSAIEDAKKYLEGKGIRYIEKTGTTTDEVSQAVDALIAEKVDAVFTPTDNTIQKAELAIYEKLENAGVPHYTGADSFALNGAFVGYGVDYENLGRKTAEMIDEVLRNGKKPAELPVQTFDNGIVTVNTDTAEKLGYNMEELRKTFAPLATRVEETGTRQEFSN